MSTTHLPHRVTQGKPTKSLVLPTPPSPAPKASAAHKRRLTPRRAIIIGASVLVVVGAGLGTWVATRPAPTSATTSIVTVGYGTISQTASATGTIAAASTANVNFAVSGRVTAVDVTVGQAVTAGQTLATIDPTALTYQVDESEAELASAQAKLSADQSVSSTPSAQITADDAAVTAAQASLSAAQTSLSNATLASPIAGVVASMNLVVGQQVSGSGGNSSSSGASGAASPTSSSSASSYNAASSSSASSSSSSSGSSSSNAEIVVLGSGSYVVNASVDDTEVGELQVGDQCAITPEGSTTAVYGQIASVSILATQSSGVASFPVVINVTGSPSGLYPGATAEISILVKELQNVLVVPTAAIQFVGGNTVVDVIHNGKQSVQPVTIGTASGGNTEVISGVTAGEQVVEHVTSARTSTTRPSSGYSRTGGYGGGFGGGFGGSG